MTNKKIALIIGGNSGVGKKTAQDLAQENYRIMIVARNREKGEQVVQQLQQTTRNSDISFIQADLSTKEAVTKLSRVLSENVDHVDVLVSSIGIMQPTQQLTKDGYDQNFVLNYLTHFWLINALLPLVKKSRSGSNSHGRCSTSHRSPVENKSTSACSRCRKLQWDASYWRCFRRKNSTDTEISPLIKRYQCYSKYFSSRKYS